MGNPSHIPAIYRTFLPQVAKKRVTRLQCRFLWVYVNLLISIGKSSGAKCVLHVSLLHHLTKHYRKKGIKNGTRGVHTFTSQILHLP